MPRFIPLHCDIVIAIAKHLGYVHYRTKGSHEVYVKSGEPLHVTIPRNREIPKGTLVSIMKQLRLTREQFLELSEKFKH